RHTRSDRDWSSDVCSSDLLAIEVALHEPRPLLRFLVPKPEGGYRVATRLDPLDALIYTALVYDFVPRPEKSRIPRRRRIACSYRSEERRVGKEARSRWAG